MKNEQNEYISKTQKLFTCIDEIDFNNNLKPSSIMHYFQDIATNHAVDLGVGYCKMKEKEICWVLSRLSYKIFEMPEIGKELIFKTYPKKPNMVDCIRDYYILDENGKVFISGTSKWCVLSVTNRAIRRCDNLYFYDDSNYNPKSPFDNGNPRIESIAQLAIEKSKPFNFDVKITDLDTNNHMNNARYGDAVLNCCSIDELTDKKIVAFDMNFLSELLYKDNYCIIRADKDKFSYFEATKTNENKVVFRAKIEWDI